MKRSCAACKVPYKLTEEDLKMAEVTADSVEGGTFFKGEGCVTCNNTGYKGRIGIYEMMRNTPELEELIYQGADTMSLRAMAESQGMRSLRGLALEKWRAGMTTVQEVQRVTMGGH